MTQAVLSDLIALGEGFTTEFKRSGTAGLGREICAFANATGGTILLGVADDGEVCGVANHNRLKSEIQSMARSADPPIAVEIESAGQTLCVTVPAQQSKPYSFGGKFFIREGSSSQQMSREEIREFFYKEGLIHFDETACDKFSLEGDLDEENWSLFQHRAKIPAEMEPETALRNLHLIGEDGRTTHAGAWLLARDIRKFNISADVACALFMGIDKVRILDRRDFHNDVYSMIEGVMAWILSKINIEYIIKRVKREERPELPEEAIREAVVNALVHRDYRSTANTQIYLFTDRLEIVSPGGLPAGMTEADLGLKSIPRNPLLFGILHRMEAVERIGSGIRRIRDLCREHGVAEPVIEVSESWVGTTFKRPGDLTRTQTVTKSGSRPEPSQVGDPVGTKWGPSQDQAEIIRNCMNEKAISELMQVIGRSNRTKFRDQVIKPLLEAGWLEMTVPDKPTSSKQKYRLTDKGRELQDRLRRTP